TAGIVVVPYDPSNGHAAAWDLLESYRIGDPPRTAEEYESQQVKNHLAAAYARAKGRHFRADRDRMLSALMVPLLSEIGLNVVVDVEEFLARAEERLALPRSFDRSHLMEALKILERDGVVVLQGTSLLIGDVGTPKELEQDATRLVNGLIA